MFFILGGNGFVGSAYARQLEMQGFPYAVIGKSNYAQYVGRTCDVLINANGSSSKRLAEADPALDFQLNVESVRRSLSDFRFETYVFLSSGDVYPDCSSPETTQESTAIDPSLQSTYGFHKYLAELYVRHEARRWLIVRQGGFVGPGMMKNAIFDVLYGDRVWVQPNSCFQFIHTDDSAKIVLSQVEKVDNRIANLSGSGTISVAEMGELASKELIIDSTAREVRCHMSMDYFDSLSEVAIPSTRHTVTEFILKESSGQRF